MEKIQIDLDKKYIFQKEKSLQEKLYEAGISTLYLPMMKKKFLLIDSPCGYSEDYQFYLFDDKDKLEMFIEKNFEAQIGSGKHGMSLEDFNTFERDERKELCLEEKILSENIEDILLVLSKEYGYDFKEMKYIKYIA